MGGNLHGVGVQLSERWAESAQPMLNFVLGSLSRAALLGEAQFGSE